MYPQTDLVFASQIVAQRARHAELQRDMRAARSKRRRFRFSRRSTLARRPVVGVVR
jgi:hypothetical protein